MADKENEFFISSRRRWNVFSRGKEQIKPLDLSTPTTKKRAIPGSESRGNTSVRSPLSPVINNTVTVIPSQSNRCFDNIAVTDEEDEVFFGEITPKERQKAAKYSKRRTALFIPGFRRNKTLMRYSVVPKEFAVWYKVSPKSDVHVPEPDSCYKKEEKNTNALRTGMATKCQRSPVKGANNLAGKSQQKKCHRSIVGGTNNSDNKNVQKQHQQSRATDIPSICGITPELNQFAVGTDCKRASKMAKQHRSDTTQIGVTMVTSTDVDGSSKKSGSTTGNKENKKETFGKSKVSTTQDAGSYKTHKQAILQQKRKKNTVGPMVTDAKPNTPEMKKENKNQNKGKHTKSINNKLDLTSQSAHNSRKQPQGAVFTSTIRNLKMARSASATTFTKKLQSGFLRNLSFSQGKERKMIEISPKDKVSPMMSKRSPKDGKLTKKLSKISPPNNILTKIVSKISPKDKASRRIESLKSVSEKSELSPTDILSAKKESEKSLKDKSQIPLKDKELTSIASEKSIDKFEISPKDTSNISQEDKALTSTKSKKSLKDKSEMTPKDKELPSIESEKSDRDNRETLPNDKVLIYKDPGFSNLSGCGLVFPNLEIVLAKSEELLLKVSADAAAAIEQVHCSPEQLQQSAEDAAKLTKVTQADSSAELLHDLCKRSQELLKIMKDKPISRAAANLSKSMQRTYMHSSASPELVLTGSAHHHGWQAQKESAKTHLETNRFDKYRDQKAQYLTCSGTVFNKNHNGACVRSNEMVGGNDIDIPRKVHGGDEDEKRFCNFPQSDVISGCVVEDQHGNTNSMLSSGNTLPAPLGESPTLCLYIKRPHKQISSTQLCSDTTQCRSHAHENKPAAATTADNNTAEHSRRQSQSKQTEAILSPLRTGVLCREQTQSAGCTPFYTVLMNGENVADSHSDKHNNPETNHWPVAGDQVIEMPPARPVQCPSQLDLSPPLGNNVSPKCSELSPNSSSEMSPSLELSPSELDLSPSQIGSSPTDIQISPSQLHLSPMSPTDLDVSPTLPKMSPVGSPVSPTRTTAARKSPSSSPDSGGSSTRALLAILAEKKQRLQQLREQKRKIQEKLASPKSNTPSATHAVLPHVRLTLPVEELEEAELERVTRLHTLHNGQRVVRMVDPSLYPNVTVVRHVPGEQMATRVKWNASLVKPVDSLHSPSKNCHAGPSILHQRPSTERYPYSDQAPSPVIIHKARRSNSRMRRN